MQGSHDSLERQALDDNTRLQVRGAMKQMRVAIDSMGSSLLLGGELKNAQDDMQDLLTISRDVVKAAVITAYRHKMPLATVAGLLGLEVTQVLAFLVDHFDNDREFANRWLQAEQVPETALGDSMADVFARGAQR